MDIKASLPKKILPNTFSDSIINSLKNTSTHNPMCQGTKETRKLTPEDPTQATLQPILTMQQAEGSPLQLMATLLYNKRAKPKKQKHTTIESQPSDQYAQNIAPISGPRLQTPITCSSLIHS